MAKPTTSYASVSKNTTSFSATTKPTTDYGNNSSYNEEDGTRLNSTVVTLNSSSVYLNGFTTATVGNQLNDKASTSFTEVAKPTTSFTGITKPTTNYGEV